jgi:DUF971 family protein
MNIFPKQIKLSEQKDNLIIIWNDDSINSISLLKLRKLCPCATCLTEKENQSPTYIPLFAENQIKIKNINQVGNYAISILWQDGHNTGIYEFPYLKLICEKSD